MISASLFTERQTRLARQTGERCGISNSLRIKYPFKRTQKDSGSKQIFIFIINFATTAFGLPVVLAQIGETFTTLFTYT